MQYIGTTEREGHAIYFDVHAAERCGQGVCVSGTVGDGLYEGEVVVEIGRDASVAFADAWLGGYGLDDFLDRCGPGEVEKALVDAVREMPFLAPRAYRPHAYRPKCTSGRVTERGPFWKGLS